MAMIDKKIMDSFEQEWEIPDCVTEKMRGAYRQIGASETGVPVHVNRKVRRLERRYVKAASFVAAVLILGVTAGAATGLNEPLQRLFQKDAGLARESSSIPEAKPVKNTLKDLDVEVESVSGTDELAYIVLHVQRTDGGTFDKNIVYDFGSIKIRESEPDHADRQRADYESVESGRSFMLENEGTTEVRIVYLTAYKQQAGGKVDYRRGKQCELTLHDWVGESDEGNRTVQFHGKLELSFKMDYGDALTKTKKTDVDISFPVFGTDKYIPMGRLREFTLTPYYIQYKTQVGKKQHEHKIPDWDHQVYVEMDDGSFIGYRTEEDMKFRWRNALSALGDGSFDKNAGTGEEESIVMFPELIDVSRVRAVYFGKTRIELGA